MTKKGWIFDGENDKGVCQTIYIDFMKVYFRLLSFAKPIYKYAIPYVLFTLLAILFGTLNLALLAPLLTTLFDHGTSVPVVAIDGKVRFRGVVNPVLLERLLKAEAARKAGE